LSPTLEKRFSCSSLECLAQPLASHWKRDRSSHPWSSTPAAGLPTGCTPVASCGCISKLFEDSHTRLGQHGHASQMGQGPTDRRERRQSISTRTGIRKTGRHPLWSISTHPMRSTQPCSRALAAGPPPSGLTGTRVFQRNVRVLAADRNRLTEGDALIGSADLLVGEAIAWARTQVPGLLHDGRRCPN
jgi:hypothetical protein